MPNKLKWSQLTIQRTGCRTLLYQRLLLYLPSLNLPIWFQPVLFHKPKSIIAARNILYASLFLGVLGFLISEFSSIMPGRLNMHTLISNLTILLLLFIATYYIGFGKKWARTLFLALFIINAGASPIYVPFIFQASLVIGFLFILQMLLQILALHRRIYCSSDLIAVGHHHRLPSNAYTKKNMGTKWGRR